MAFQLNHHDEELAEAHEINVTPFIDVMLVLLIIFMIAAPLATVDINVDLPAATAERQPRPDSPIFLTLREDLALALGDNPIQRKDLKEKLDQATEADHGRRLFLRADKALPYGELMTLMDELRGAGYLKIALVSLEQATVKQASDL